MIVDRDKNDAWILDKLYNGRLRYTRKETDGDFLVVNVIICIKGDEVMMNRIFGNAATATATEINYCARAHTAHQWHSFKHFYSPRIAVKTSWGYLMSVGPQFASGALY